MRTTPSRNSTESSATTTLSRDVIGGRFERRRRPPIQLEIELDLDGGALRQRLEGVGQTTFGEDRGMDPAGELAQLRQCLGQLLARRLEQRHRGGGLLLDLRLRQPQGQR